MKFGALLSAATLAASAVAAPVQAQSMEEIQAAYEANKPSPGGISPSTRGEYAMCMAAWGVMGAFAVSEPELAPIIHPVLSEDETNALFAHWWIRAEDAYGSERAERFSQDLQEAADRITAHLTEQNLVQPMGTLGTCYVEAGARNDGADRVTVRSLLETRNSIVLSASELREYMGS